MNPSDSEDHSLLNFLKNEIKGQVLILRDVIAHLQDSSFMSTEIEKGKKSAKEIVKLLGIYPWNSVIPLIQNLEQYFQAIQEGMHIQPSHVETLAATTGELLYLVELETSQLEQILQNHKESIHNLANQFSQFLQEFKGKQIEQEIIENGNQEEKIEKQLSKSSISFSNHSFDPTMYDLFCVEIETQSQILNEGLIEIERKPKDQKLLETLMRAAHSIKGAARVVNLDPIVGLAHAMEDSFVAAQHNQIEITVEKIDQLLRSVDLLARLYKVNVQEIHSWLQEQFSLIESLTQELSSPITTPKNFIAQKSVKKLTKREPTHIPTPFEIKSKEENKKNEIKIISPAPPDRDRVLRITADNLNRLMGLAGESLIESRWLHPFSENLQEIKSRCYKIENILNVITDNIDKKSLSTVAQTSLVDLHYEIHLLRSQFNERLSELDYFIWRYAHLSDRLYYEVIKSRMRPFNDGVEAFPRMVRDLARQLGKSIRLEIEGKSTLVDRDILEKLESPLSHLLRNAIDHGIELPKERLAAGKPVEAVIKLSARHRGGMLAITVCDDGKGIDIEYLRKKIVEKNLVSEEMASRLTESEVIDFLFLPGFSTSSKLTEISGRGIGLNIVQSTVQEVGGVIRTQSALGKGTTFHLQLPLTLSVIRALLVEIAGEAYAFPLARIDQAFLIAREKINFIENRQFFQYEGQNIGLISAWEVLELNEPHLKLERLPVIVLSERLNSYGLVVDRFIGEKELVVQELDPRLGKIPDIVAGAIMEDGSPILIIDIEDIIRSIDYMLSGGRLAKVSYSHEEVKITIKKRILVVDDSITVREVECRLLLNHGYEVETAVNGVDGWNAVRLSSYDLVITDIDMPRMNGIELLRAIRNDPKLQHLPVMIVSYKEGEEDRLRGLEAGADYYLTKSSFHDTSLIEAVKDLIGDS